MWVNWIFLIKKKGISAYQELFAIRKSNDNWIFKNLKNQFSVKLKQNSLKINSLFFLI